MKTNFEIPNPSKNEVKKYLKMWEDEESNHIPGKVLERLFRQTYPSNKNIDEVLTKVYILNSAYNTHILSPLTVAKHIVELNIDRSLSKDDLTIVNKIADVEMNGGRKISFYSFATKYCHFHKADTFSIFDSYVEKMLIYFRKKDHFSDFTKNDLRTYEKFDQVMSQFKKRYNLESFTVRDIDKYLWLAGKTYFPLRREDKSTTKVIS